ncbi:hypothetical protein Tco_1116656, partial [Tanacetum coccineum]
EDRFYASISMDPSIAKDIYHPDWELTNDFIMDKGPLCRDFIDHLATLGMFSCLRSLSHQDVCDRANVAATRHITLFSEIRLRLEHVKLTRSQLERRLARRDAALEKRDAEITRLQKLVNEKPSGEMARLRLGFEGAEREVGRLRKQVEELKKEAGKDPELLPSYSQKETDLSIINGKYQDLLREKEQLELRNTSFQGQVDGQAEVKAEFSHKLADYHWKFNEQVAELDARLDKMAKETDEEFAHMLTDAKKTKEFLIGKGFRYFLNKFKESNLLVPNLIEACDDQPLSYLEALIIMRVHESIQDEAGISTNLASGETSFAGGDAEQFIIAPSVPYVEDAGATAQDVTLVDGVVTVESDEVPAGIAPHNNDAATLASTPDVLNSDPATLVIPTSSIFE